MFGTSTSAIREQSGASQRAEPFSRRPRSEGLWLRITFREPPNAAPSGPSLSLIYLKDSPLRRSHPHRRPPHRLAASTSPHLIFAPTRNASSSREAPPSTELQILAVITSPSRRKALTPTRTDSLQEELFHDPSPTATHVQTEPCQPVSITLNQLANHLRGRTPRRSTPETTDLRRLWYRDCFAAGHLSLRLQSPLRPARPHHAQASCHPRRTQLSRISRVPPSAPRNPYLAFARAVELFYPAPRHTRPGTHPTAVIAPYRRTVGPEAHIGPYVVVMDDVTLSDPTRPSLLAHVIIYPHVTASADRLFAHAHSIVREHCRSR